MRVSNLVTRGQCQLESFFSSYQQRRDARYHRLSHVVIPGIMPVAIRFTPARAGSEFLFLSSLRCPNLSGCEWIRPTRPGGQHNNDTHTNTKGGDSKIRVICTKSITYPHFDGIIETVQLILVFCHVIVVVSPPIKSVLGREHSRTP